MVVERIMLGVENRLIVRKNELNFKIRWAKFNKNNKYTTNLTTWFVFSGVRSLVNRKLFISVDHNICESQCRVCYISKR